MNAALVLCRMPAASRQTGLRTRRTQMMNRACTQYMTQGGSPPSCRRLVQDVQPRDGPRTEQQSCTDRRVIRSKKYGVKSSGRMGGETRRSSRRWGSSRGREKLQAITTSQQTVNLYSSDPHAYASTSGTPSDKSGAHTFKPVHH